MERITYVIGLLCSILSQLLFFFFTSYHTDETGMSWILFHQEDWRWAFALSILAMFFIVLGIAADIKDERGKERAPPQEKIQKPQKDLVCHDKPSEKLTDLEETPEREESGDKEEKAEAPAVWKEKEFE